MLRIAIALFAAFLFAAPADAAKRVALVIGNSAYAHAPALPNPKNDASDMAAKLEGLGFAVVSGVDLDLAGVKAKVREFRAAATSADLALFFYAGHGIQVDGVNYMIPVDADIADEAALDFEAVEMEAVLKAMADTPTLVVLLDACRDNPFGEKLARSLRRGGRTRNIALGKGLAQLDAGTGTLVAFSTQPGNVALDGEGRNSPFTAGLLKHLGQPGMSITDELILVRNAVLDATANRQRPWDSSSLTGRVVLNAAAAQELAPRAASQIEADFDLARSLGTKEAWEAFLERHGASGDMRVALAKRETGRLSLDETPARDETAAADESRHNPKESKVDDQSERRETLGLTLAENSGGAGIVVKSVSAGSTAFQAGVVAGEVVLEVSTVEMKKPQDLVEQVERSRSEGRKRILFLISSGETMRFATVSLDN